MRKTGIFDNKKMPNLNGGFFSALIFIKFYRNIKNITRKFLRISPLFPFPRKKRISSGPGPARRVAWVDADHGTQVIKLVANATQIPAVQWIPACAGMTI